MKKGMIPDKINNYNLYHGVASGDSRLVGVTDEIKLIDIENMSESINLAGWGGEFNSPAVGQFKSMALEIPFANTTKEMLQIAADDSEPIIARSAQEFIDPETGNKEMVNRTITVRGMTTKISYGSLKKAGYGKPSITKETYYYQDVIDGEVVTLIDKFKGIAIIGGVDVTKDIQSYI